MPFAATLLIAPATPLIFTDVTPKKPDPFTVITCPAKPAPGVNPVTAGCKPNDWALTALPAIVPCTVILPVTVPFGTVAVTWVGESTVTDGEAMPLNLTTGAVPPPMKHGFPMVEQDQKKFVP